LLNGVCMQCGYGAYAVRGNVGLCVSCPLGSNHTVMGSSSISDCKCVPGFFGDATMKILNNVSSLHKTCNGSHCPAFAWS
jgi:hypothetical protein